jgi:hypothetical protein
MSPPSGNRQGRQQSLLRLLGAVACVAVALGWPAAHAARADDSLVLSATDFSTLHLRPAGESVRAARAQLDAGLPRSARATIDGAPTQASAASGHGRHWRSDAFVLGSARVATATLASWRHHHHAKSAKVGGGGAAFVQRSRHGQTVQVLWRDGSRLGLIVLGTRARPRQARAAALAYAVLADGSLKTPLPQTAWGKVMAQVRPDGSVSKQTALEAFALSYGGLPGVRVPSGKRTAPLSGDLAFDWVAPYLPKLSASLRRAIDHTMGFASPGQGAHAADYGDPGFTANAALTSQANKWAGIFASPLYLGHLLNLQIIAGTTTTNIHNQYTNTDAPADADSINAAGDRTADGPFCRIRITPEGQHYDNATTSHLLAHEVFHCEEFDLDPGLSNLHAWTTEGLAEWAAETLAPTPGYLPVLDGYFDTPHQALFTRNYDAEGFWGRIQDAAPDLWRKIPAILSAPTQQGQFAAAGGLATAFLTTWGSSFFNDHEAGLNWSDVSPQKTDDGAGADVIDGTGTMLAAPYTTSLYSIEATQPLEEVTVSPPTDTLLGEDANRTDLTSTLFCTAKSSSACQCPAGDDGTVPPSQPLTFPSTIGITGDPDRGTTGTVTAIALSTYCTPKTPATRPGAPGTDGGSGGDPHDFDFDGGLFDFQQAGEFTLVKSTKGVDVQVRQQPLSNCCVSFNTAAAMRVGHATVEVDRQGASGISVYVDQRVVHGASVKLAGGGQLSVGPGQYGTTATVTWPDQTTVKVFNAGGLGSGVLDVSVALATDQLGHVSGLLGDAGGPAAQEFVSPSGHPYPASVITGSSQHDLKVRYDQFGNGWRITQRESLFHYAHGQSTRSFTIRSFPATFETVGSLPAAKRAAAEKACKAAGIASPKLLDACELDVAATGDKGFATGDANLQSAVANAPGWAQLSPTAPASASVATSLLTPTLGEAGGRVLAAYDQDKSTSVQVASFPDGPGAPSSVTRTTPISGWSDLSAPLLVPTPDGGQQLVVSGTHSSVVSDSLNGLDTVALQPNGTFAAPVAIAPSELVPGAATADGAALASDGHSLIWSSNLFLDVFNDVVYPPTSQDPVYPEGTLLEATTASTLAYDTSGRLWLAWYGISLGGDVGDGLFMEQLNPATGAPVVGATAQLVPDSGSPADAGNLLLACNSICHIVYPPTGAKTKIVSWAPGESQPVTIIDVGAHAFMSPLGAAAAPDGRIWVAYLYDNAASPGEQVVARLGNDDGAGGTAIAVSPPPGQTLAYSGSVLATSRGLALAVDFAKSAKDPTSTLWGTVLSQP